MSCTTKLKQCIKPNPETEAWFKYLPIVYAIFRILRVASFFCLVLSTILSYHQTPYHLQMRRIANRLSMEIGSSSVRTSASVECPLVTLNSINDQWDVLNIDHSVGYTEFDNSANYDLISDTDRTPWDDIQTYSKLLAAAEIALLISVIITSVWFVTHVCVGSVTFFVNSDEPTLEDSDDDEKNCCCGISWNRGRNEFISQLAYVINGLLIVIILIFKFVCTMTLQRAQTSIVTAYDDTCAIDPNGDCFVDGTPELCTELAGSTWLGQNTVSGLDIVRFGTEPKHCSDATKDLVRFGTPEYFATGGEGFVPHMGTMKLTCADVTGIIVSTHVFTVFFIVLAVIDVFSVVYSIYAIAQTSTFESLISGFTNIKAITKKTVNKIKDVTRKARAQINEDGVRRAKRRADRHAAQSSAAQPDNGHDMFPGLLL